jgi:hypothetical protein
MKKDKQLELAGKDLEKHWIVLRKEKDWNKVWKFICALIRRNKLTKLIKR